MMMSKRYLALVAALVVVAAVLIWRGVATDSEEESPAAEVSNVQASGIGEEIARRSLDDPLALGDVDAPVVMVEYADFRCPFCGVFARDTKPELMDLVEDGTLRIEFRDLPIFGAQSERAARAGRAAAEQGRFWEFYDLVFADAPERGHADLDDQALRRFAQEAGVSDMDQFDRDMDSEHVAAAVQADQDEAYALGASSTPLFIVGDTPVLGAQPTDAFLDLIAQEEARG